MRYAILILALTSACSGAFDRFGEAKALAAQDMKDPESVQFRNVDYCASKSVIRGERNGKNSFGAYEGFEQFWVWQGKLYTSDATAEDFEKVMAACADVSVAELRRHGVG